MASKSKSNKAFLEKLKTLHISTGSGQKCPDCGNPMAFIAAGIICISAKQPESKSKSKSNNSTEEAAFAV